MYLNPIAIFVFLCGVMTISIAQYAWQHRSTNGAAQFALFMLTLSIYIIGYSLELSSLSVQTMLFFSKIQYIGILTAPALFTIFAIYHSGHQHWLSARVIAALFVAPAALLITKFTDDYFHLIYAAASVDSSGLIPLLSFTRGPLYLWVVMYNLVLTTAGNLLMLQKMWHGSRLYRRQTSLILGGALVLYSVYLIYQADIILVPGLKQLDLNPFVYTLWGLAISTAIFRYRLFDLEPIARDVLIEMLSDGVIVLDGQARIVDANPEAHKIFGWRHPPVGKFAEQVMDNWLSQTALNAVEKSLKFEAQRTVDQHTSYYEVTISVLFSRRGLRIGYLILVHDISEMKEVEYKLQELSLVDDLTGLTNRRGLNLLAGQLLGMTSRMRLNAILLYIDLDGLKIINDTLGHAAGDRALKDMAALLRTTFRVSDIISRLGGDEFVVLALESTENPNDIIIQRLQENLCAHNSQPDLNYRLAFSFGIARYKWDAPASMELLLEEADKTMYEQKQRKKASI